MVIFSKRKPDAVNMQGLCGFFMHHIYNIKQNHLFIQSQHYSIVSTIVSGQPKVHPENQ